MILNANFTNRLFQFFLFQQLDKKFKISVIYLLDSIVKTVDAGLYRTLFGQKLPDIVFHVFKTATAEIQNSLCATRQTWNSLFAVEFLNELDAKVRKLDSHWPYTQSQRKLMTEVKKVDSEIELMRREIRILEQQFDSAKMCDTKKRCRTEMVVDEISSKQQKIMDGEGKLSFDCDSEKNLLLSSSSVLLTPSPERDNSDSDDGTFWSAINFERKKSNSPSFMDQNGILPFLNGSIHENSAVEKNVLNVSVEMQNSNSKENLEQTYEEMAAEKELEVMEPNAPFINLDDYTESMCTIPNAIIKTEPKEQENEEAFDYFEVNENEVPPTDNIIHPTNSAEPHRTLPPLMLSIDGNIELEPLKPFTKTSKQIKINLTNSKFVADVVEKRIDSSKIPDALSEAEQPKQKKSSEWETPLIAYKVKESMKSATFHEQPICRKGWQQAGLCSIM